MSKVIISELKSDQKVLQEMAQMTTTAPQQTAPQESDVQIMKPNISVQSSTNSKISDHENPKKYNNKHFNKQMAAGVLFLIIIIFIGAKIYNQSQAIEVLIREQQQMKKNYQFERKNIKQDFQEMFKILKESFQKRIETNNYLLETKIKIMTQMMFQPTQSLTLGSNETCSNLKSCNTINLQTLKILASIKNPKLTYLYLWNNQLGNQIGNIILSAPWFEQLKVLQLNGNNLDDQFMSKILQKKHPNLIWLNLKNNLLTQKGMEKFIENSHMLSGLKYINYNRNNIKDIYKVHYRLKQLLPEVRIGEQIEEN